MSGTIDRRTIRLLYLKNVGLALEIVLLSCQHAGIKVLPDCRPRSWNSNFRLRPKNIGRNYNDTLDPENVGLAADILLLSCILVEIRLITLFFVVISYF